MSNFQKDKRTKEQIIRLLDNAIEQEDRLSEKIKSLEAQLAECRKKAEDPRHELTEEALSASKVSFRIDYYRTAEKGPLKGIIEHLPSRKNKAFEGEGESVITAFMSRFLVEETGNGKKRKVKKEEQKPVEASTPEVAAPLPEAVIADSEAVLVEATTPVVAETELSNAIPEMESMPEAPETPDTGLPAAILPEEDPEITITEADTPPEMPQPEVPVAESGLMHRLKSAILTEPGESETNRYGNTRAVEPGTKTGATHQADTMAPAMTRRAEIPPVIRPSLLERVQEEYRRTLAEGSN